jgi:hypothetical protein
MASLSDQTVCTPQQLQDGGALGFYCLTRRQNIGLVVRIMFLVALSFNIDFFRLLQ